jgi:hypothetical protein
MSVSSKNAGPVDGKGHSRIDAESRKNKTANYSKPFNDHWSSLIEAKIYCETV